MRDTIRILVWSSAGIIVFGVAIVLAGLLVAKAAPLAEMRRSVAELFLTYLLGAPVQVDGDVEVNLWPRLEFKLDEIATSMHGGRIAIRYDK